MISITPTINDSSNYLTIDQFENLYFEEVLQKVVSESSLPFEEARKIITYCFQDLKAAFPLKEYWKEKKLWKEFRKIVHRQQYKLKKRMDKNFGLSEASFKVLLKELNEDNDALFEKIFLTHFKSCQVYLQRNYNASSEDAYDATMNTLIEFQDRLKAGKITYGNLRFLFTRMAGQIYLKWIKKENKTTSIGELDIPESFEELDEESFKILNKAWEKLCDDCRALLKEFYYDGKALNQLAERMEKSHSAVRKQKQRCVEKLRDLFIKNT